MPWKGTSKKSSSWCEGWAKREKDGGRMIRMHRRGQPVPPGKVGTRDVKGDFQEILEEWRRICEGAGLIDEGQMEVWKKRWKEASEKEAISNPVEIKTGNIAKRKNLFNDQHMLLVLAVSMGGCTFETWSRSEPRGLKLKRW